VASYIRLYAGPDGESHFQDVDVDLGTDNRAPMIPTTSLIFAEHQAGYVSMWHTVSRRQFVITLRGSSELETSDGQKRRTQPGTIMLCEDTTGKGHVLRILEDRMCVYVPAPDVTLNVE
jgi:hypothetical protein